jgi:long-chain acyl-CoA synthetase
MTDKGASARAQDYDRWTSLPEAFFEVAARESERPFLWSKRNGSWQALSYAEVARQVRALSRGLRALGLERGERVVLVSESRPEFLIADLAIMAVGAITVPAYTTNTEADHAHILEDSEAAMAIVSTRTLAQPLMAPAERAPDCRLVVAIEDIDDEAHRDIPVHYWQVVLEQGGQQPDDVDEKVAAIGRDDVACFIYTSGTGGAPKGVMLTHGNLLSNGKMAFQLLFMLGLEEKEIFLSFLPLSHAYEHTAGQFFPMTIGAQIYYSRGVEHLSGELGEVRPTIMTAVPRLYESLYQRIMRGVNKASPLRRKMFQRALDLGRKRYHGKRLGPLEWVQDRVLDKLVRDKVRARFGGRLKGMVSGGAALNPDIGIFFQALGLRILQGYGQTEAAPIISCNPPDKPKLDSVGPPLVGVEAKLASDGELLVRGPMVMKGYWRMPEHTAETIVDGWLHTGDLATIDDDGYIRITDRKKDIVVLSGGDTLSPARVEGFLTRQPEIGQAMVYGDKRPHLVALLVPDEEFAIEWAKSHGKPCDLAQISADEEFRGVMQEAIRRVNLEVAQSEKVRRFAVAPEAFTVANDMMTPTLKIRRHRIREAYGQKLEELY